MKFQPLLTALALGSLGSLAMGQTCSVVADMNTIGSGFSSNPEGETLGGNAYVQDSFLKLGGFWYFSAKTLFTGEELFRTDGTSATPTLVKDLNPGSGDSFISRMTIYNGMLWFTATDGVVGNELWVSDGTTAGTTLVTDIRVGSGTSSINFITGLGGKVYFGANDNVNGTELWVSDGTAVGTQMVKDIRPGSSSSSVSEITLDPTGTKLLFRANDGTNGTELWESDGTAAGTLMITDINPGTSSSNPDYMIHWNGEVYFSASDGTTGTELWKTDGTALGTSQVADINPGGGSGSVNLNYFADFGGELYFRATGPNGSELHKTDGTALGTVEVKDIDVVGSSNPGDMLVYNGLLYFTADDNSANGRELWRTDGTFGGTTLVADIQGGASDGVSFSGNNLMISGGELFFKARSSSSDYELWKTDGVSTTLVKDIEPGTTGSTPDWFTPISPTQMMFTAKTTVQGEELWITDGTTAGTTLLAEVDNNTITGDANPDDMHSVDGQYMLLLINDGVIGEELYRWDALAGLTLIADVNPGSSNSSINEFHTAYIGGKLLTFFEANDGTSGNEPWVTDGTAAGTFMLKDIRTGSSSAGPSGFFSHPVHKAVYFSAKDDIAGTEMWRTDGTTAGTYMVVDINPGVSTSGTPNSGFPSQFAAFGPDLVFRGDDGVNGREAWISDSSPFGTNMLVDLYPGASTGGTPNSSSPANFMEFNGKLLFVANDGNTGTEFFESDSTALGTQLLIDIRPGTSGSGPNDFATYNGELFFEANDGTNGSELWKTDGTAAGTTMVADTRPGSSSGSPANMMVSNGKLFFSAYDPATVGRELWTSDGTTLGTALVTDINVGTSSATPSYFAAASTGIYFKATGPSGSELYFSDGTAAGTTLVCDIFPGAVSSGPTDLMMNAGDLFFKADDAYLGKELYHVPTAGAYTQDLGLSGNGSVLSADFPLLGSTVAISVENAPVGSIGLLMMSAPTNGPASFLTNVNSVSWIDPLTYSILNVFLTPSFATTAAVPATPALVGGQVHLQSWAIPGSGLPASTSNGLQLVIGN